MMGGWTPGDRALPKQEPDLFVVRHYDGFDNEWIDVFGPDTKDACHEEWRKRTDGGTKSARYADIDYYKVFPADITMVNSEQGNRELGIQTIRDAPEPEPERLPSRAEHGVEPWGHKVHVSIYYKGDATELEIQGIIEGVNEIAPDAEFIGVEVHTVSDEPRDQGAA
jgi:hypothetical protein